MSSAPCSRSRISADDASFVLSPRHALVVLALPQCSFAHRQSVELLQARRIDICKTLVQAQLHFLFESDRLTSVFYADMS